MLCLFPSQQDKISLFTTLYINNSMDAILAAAASLLVVVARCLYLITPNKQHQSTRIQQDNNRTVYAHKTVLN